MISDGKKQALKQLLMNYVNDDDANVWETITAITALLGCGGEKSLRDEFAMAALSGLLADENVRIGGDYNLKVAQTCYVLADSMMEARK